jgi:hypothetical protein
MNYINDAMDVFFGHNLPWNISKKDRHQKNEGDEILYELVTGVFIEFASNFLIAGGIKYFVNKESVNLFKSALGVSIFNSFMRLIIYASNDSFLNKKQHAKANQNEEEKKSNGYIVSFLECISALNFTCNIGRFANTFIHESGHAFVTQMVYRNVQSSITIMESGYGRHSKKEILGREIQHRLLGQLLGGKKSYCLTIASGPLLDLIATNLLLCLSYKLTQKRSLEAKSLKLMSLFSTLDSVSYAFLAYRETKLSNDYRFLKIYAGISPGIAVLCHVAIPMIIILGNILQQRSVNQNKPEAEAS